MYKLINSRDSVPNNYEKLLVEQEKLLDKKELHDEVGKFKTSLDDALNNVLNGTYKIAPRNTYLNKQWSTMNLASNKERTNWNTGCNVDLLKYIGVKSVDYPKDFVRK
jgi:probable 2-oxoglutarate dehydrogenase E1 component DHKTD1